jgi:transketolase
MLSKGHSCLAQYGAMVRRGYFPVEEMRTAACEAARGARGQPSVVLARTGEVGRGVVLREGSDVALIGTGTQTPRLLEAADVLGQRGVSAYVLHLATLKPIDVEAIVRAAQVTGLVVTSEDHSIIGGLGSAVAEVLAEHVPARLKRTGLQDVYAESGPNDALIQKYGLSSEHVVAAAEELLRGHY